MGRVANVTISKTMILALAKIYSEPSCVAGPTVGERWVNANTRRALIKRGLAETARDEHASLWLIITKAGLIVIAAYLLGAADEARRAELGRAS